MKGYGMIILILGLGALTGYWGITSDRMARSFNESRVSLELVPEAKACETLCARSGKPVNLKNDTAHNLPEFE